MAVFNCSMRRERIRLESWLAALLAFLCAANPLHAQTKAEVDEAKRALDLKLYMATTDALVAQREPEIRKATAEAERAELLARVPPVESKALAGTINSEAFGAAGLVRAFDLAQALSVEVCTALPADRRVTLYEAAATQGVVSARLVNDGIRHISGDLARQNDELQKFIDPHTPSDARTLSLVRVGAVPATIKAVADISALFRSNAAAASASYGEQTRAMFALHLPRPVPARLQDWALGIWANSTPPSTTSSCPGPRTGRAAREVRGARRDRCSTSTCASKA